MPSASFYLISKILIFLLPSKLIKYLYSVLAAQLFGVLQLAYEVISKNTLLHFLLIYHIFALCEI